MSQVRVLEAEQPRETEQVARLLRDYLLWLRRQFAHAPDIIDAVYDPSEWESELADLKGHFGAPHGAMLIGMFGTTPAACATMRGIGRSTCEMRSLFVRPAYQGHGIARCLLVQLNQLAFERGYKRMRVAAGIAQLAPQRLYRELGFEPVGPSIDDRFNEELVFFEGRTAEIAARDCVSKRLFAAA